MDSQASGEGACRVHLQHWQQWQLHRAAAGVALPASSTHRAAPCAICSAGASAAPAPEPLSLGEELALLKYYGSKLQHVSRELRLPRRVLGTALAYLQRAYLSFSCMEQDPQLLILTCLYLACKVGGPGEPGGHTSRLGRTVLWGGRAWITSQYDSMAAVLLATALLLAVCAAVCADRGTLHFGGGTGPADGRAGRPHPEDRAGGAAGESPGPLLGGCTMCGAAPYIP